MSWDEFWYMILEALMRWIIIPATVLALALLVLAAPFLIYQSFHQDDDCIVKKILPVEHASYTQFIFAGKTMIPIFHPATTSDDWVCTERRATQEHAHAR